METIKIQNNTESINKIQENYPGDSGNIPTLRRELELLENKMLQIVESRWNQIQQLDPAQQSSCINLLFYIVLRSEDIRELQTQLHIMGLSSLSSSESHIYSQLKAILERLGKVFTPMDKFAYSYEDALYDIRLKSKELFGEKRDLSVPFIMVTLDTDFAEDFSKVKELLLTGMNVARINCAHDDESVWEKMIKNVKRATEETHLSCRIYMDLAGPKIRTILPGKKNKNHKIEVEPGDVIYLTDDMEDDNSIVKLVGCTIKSIIPQLKKGERVLFDDGSIECKIENLDKDRATLCVIRVSREKPYIKPEKGINFPDSKLSLSSITDFDMACLPFICQHADLIGYSFVRNSNDLVQLQNLLSVQRKKDTLIILKIETREAVKNLPALLVQGMQEKAYGVMIARGDLAIELGFERMSEIQEEILWICEAAHVPVIWATQVLETLNKTGLATRSEITDASYSGFAECVMINKGEHTVEVIETLKDILFRGGGHHIKKRYTFRPLSIAKDYLSSIVAS
ncbi:MAG TPA: pyruvate kinase [Chitinophagaceae bacterium]|nr:pyruvate kinase [Chitinophagaceae bacterium]